MCSACFEAELSNERDAYSQENVSAAPITEPEKHTAPIRLRSFIPRGRSKVVFALVMGSYSVVLGSFLATWAQVAGLRSPPRAFYIHGIAYDVLGPVVLGPVVESLFLVGVFELVRRARAPEVAQVFVAALFMSALHVRPWWPHAIIVLPSFCIQSASYLYWRKRAPWKDAFWILVSIHALNNVIPALSAFAYATHHV
jgi:hypothetical protein